MNYVNNWQRAVVLAAGVTSLALDLPDGDYRLTLTDSATAPTRWEIVSAVVAGGSGVLTRGQEGTTDQNWAAGSAIYCSFTAAQLSSIFDELAALAARVAALEPPPSSTVWDTAKIIGPLAVSTDLLTLTVTDETGGVIERYGFCIAQHPVVGKSYFEVSVTAPGSDYCPCNLGIAPADYDVAFPELQLVMLNGDAGYTMDNLIPGSENFGGGEQYFSGDTVRIAVDFAALKIWFAVNDRPWMGGGNPETGSSPSITFTGARPLFPFVWVNGLGSAATGHFSAADWSRSAPAGFSAIPLA